LFIISFLLSKFCLFTYFAIFLSFSSVHF